MCHLHTSVSRVFELFARYFHASSQLLAKKNDETYGLKTTRREKYYVKKDGKTQPPVETPYVPPTVKKSTKQAPDKTIDIFEGMTVVELSKRTGKSIRHLQDILINVGEKACSEFDSLSIDVAELVAMVFVLLPRICLMWNPLRPRF